MENRLQDPQQGEGFSENNKQNLSLFLTQRSGRFGILLRTRQMELYGSFMVLFVLFDSRSHYELLKASERFFRNSPLCFTGKITAYRFGSAQR